MTSQRANILAHVSHFLFAGGVALKFERTNEGRQSRGQLHVVIVRLESHVSLTAFPGNTRVSSLTFTLF